MRLCFIRFGDLTINGRSKNYLTNCCEEGISVYEAIERNNKYQIIMPTLSYSTCVSLSGVLNRPCYEVVGDVISCGSDGEPLLINCKIIKQLNNNQINKIGD